MKTELNYLPSTKQAELAQLVALIKETIPVEMIILFGSYARGDWVEEKHNDEHFRYQSDMDLLVIVEERKESIQSKFEQDIEVKIDQTETIKTPVSVIVHDIEHVNKCLRGSQYFFADIMKQGVVLFDSGKHQLKEARELDPQECKKLARKYYDFYFEEADKFYKLFEYAIKDGSYNVAAFLLHQVTEKLYSAILLVFTHYKPNTHNLIILRKLANSVDSRLVPVFALDTPENTRLFKLLRKSYVDARYKPSFNITNEELAMLAKQVDELKEIGKLICNEKIDSFK